MINTKQLRDLILRTLKAYNLYSEAAVNLLLGTCLQESRGGTYLRQMSNDFDINKHAIGIMQMEMNTFNWMVEKYGDQYQLHSTQFEELEYNLETSILFSRLRYLADSEPLPDAHDVVGLAETWKRVYNTVFGAGTVEEFVDIYTKYAEI